MATDLKRLQKLFIQKGKTVSLAESCTGGMIAAALTDLPGSSAYFMGGVVSYSNAAKADLLGVKPGSLNLYGAVSDVVARQMAVGARARFHTDVAFSVTGIAGPSGGTPEKPLGLTWIGVADADGDHAVRYIWQGANRAENRDLSVQEALRLLLKWIEQKGEPAPR